MSVETFLPVPLTTFGSWMTLLDPSDVLPGMSPDARDVEFFPGGVRTRPGLLSMFPALGATPSINGLKTYITTNLVQRLLVLDSLGNLFKGTSPGQLSIVASAVSPGLFLASATYFGREYMAFSNTTLGEDMPREYDDIYFDRVSQIGPAEGPSLADAPDAGNISPGAHQCAVIFVTRQGYWTIPSGGSRESSDVVWGDAYRITADGSTLSRGVIQQTVLTDASGNPLLQSNTY